MHSRVVVVNGQQLMREALVCLLQSSGDVQVVGHTGDGMDGVRLSEQHRPNHVILDLAIPGLNGVDATRRIVQAAPNTRVLCLVDGADSLTMAAVLDAGATALLPKSCDHDELRHAMQAQSMRHLYLSPDLTAIALEGMGRSGTGHAFKQLTPKEREVVQLIAEGLSTKAIANRMQVSAKTIATHREHVMSKLQLRSVAALTRYAIREGLSCL